MRKYKTTIEIVCEAEDRKEAVDVAGEYLRGSIGSGVIMRCRTKPVGTGLKFAVTGFMAISLVGAGLLSTNFTHSQQYAGADRISYNACQAPLKTGSDGAAKDNFKNSWQEKELHRALKSIKK